MAGCALEPASPCQSDESECWVQDFDMAKRHYGEILTKYDPEHKVAKDRFKELKTLQRKIDRANKVRPPLLSRSYLQGENHCDA